MPLFHLLFVMRGHCARMQLARVNQELESMPPCQPMWLIVLRVHREIDLEPRSGATICYAPGAFENLNTNKTLLASVTVTPAIVITPQCIGVVLILFDMEPPTLYSIPWELRNCNIMKNVLRIDIEYNNSYQKYLCEIYIYVHRWFVWQFACLGSGPIVPFLDACM